MRKRWAMLSVAALLVLSACVTINVYFPAAEAEEAAREFVDKVIGEGDGSADPAADKPAAAKPGAATKPPGMSLLSFFIADAHAQSADINLRTPAIQAIQARMAARFDSQLRAGFDAGALGFAGDGTIVVRDAGKLALKDRVAVNQAVADDNRDRHRHAPAQPDPHTDAWNRQANHLGQGRVLRESPGIGPGPAGWRGPFHAF